MTLRGTKPRSAVTKTAESVVDARVAIYRCFVETGRAPEGLPADTLWRLADERLLVLRPDGAEIWMAQPFSAVPTPFRVECAGRSYFGNCIWDALGIPALVEADGTVCTACADCGDPLELRVEGGRLLDGGVAHFAVPAARWWDDIGYT